MRLPLPRVTLMSVVIGALLGFTTCRLNFPNAIYTCGADSDCGGDGFVCAVKGGSGTCCKPSGAEVCDGVDNDCNGVIDDTGKREVCNGVDDDCNGKIDELFDLKKDTSNCGKCGTVCALKDLCVNGMCIPRSELDCFDGLDNDGNGKIDCLDPACEGRSCGAACICHALTKTESVCSDNLDNDGDGLKDCADPDCVAQSCGTGCQCATDGGSTEIGCSDGVDNDGDQKSDCLDPDCVGQYCTPPPIFFACTASSICRCNGSVQVAEVGSVLCRDGIDNDCNGKKDCQEASCNAQTCASDGGTSCECASGLKKEVDCANGTDDDDDGKVDCKDEDCVQGTTCTKDAGTAGVCGANKFCN